MTDRRDMPDHSIDVQVRAELVRTAYSDAIYGAPVGALVAIVFGISMLGVFPPSTVVPWVAAAVACNLFRVLTRWQYLRRPVPADHADNWAGWFAVVSGVTGLTWGVGVWIFFGANQPEVRILSVLVLAGLTTGAARLLVPVFSANLAYLYGSMLPLMARLLSDPGLRSLSLGFLCVFYLTYMTLAARQQLNTLRSTVRLGLENVALARSLGDAKESAEGLNRDLSEEITRRGTVETELRSATELAQAASRAKSEFLATISHEIRTPMNGILGMLRIVRDSALAPAQREQLDTAASSAETLLDLINDILDFSKIEAGRLDLEHIAFAPAALSGSVVDLLLPRAQAKSLSLDAEFDPQLPDALVGDPTRLRQVLLNLLGNAIKFTDAGRVALTVTCEAREATEATVRFSVSDSGIGISADSMKRVFSAFTQADSSMSRRYGGTGLGLTISQKLVAAMGGTITVRSDPGRGSTFAFTLRFARASAADQNRLRPDSGLQSAVPVLRGRVLVVEDDRVNQRIVGHFLKKMGLEFGIAEDGYDAVQWATSQPWDVVLMDCQLPSLDGLEATRRIRKAIGDRALPIIALTANAGREDRDACLAAGMDDFLTKPINLELLGATLEKWLTPGRGTGPLR